ncbi:MAG: hypothetical protein ACKKMR_03175 [Candidatus Nealsonbacteria bacterium]
MAITFQEQLKKQKNLVFIFLSLVLVTVFIIWWGYYYVGEEPREELILKHFKKIEIDFELLENPLLDQLQPIEKIPPFEGEVGRENPFIP